MQPIIDEQIIIPLNNVAYSLFPSIVVPHDDHSSSSSQTLDTALQSPEMLSPTGDQTTFPPRISVSDDSDSPIYATHIVSSPTAEIRRPQYRLRSSSQTLDAALQSPEMLSPTGDQTTSPPRISVSDDSDSPIYASHIVSSPTAETRRPHPSHRLRGYSSESTDKLGSGEISRLTRDETLVAGSSQMSFDLSTRLSHEGTTISGPTCVEDEGTPVPPPIDIAPVAPENFSRHEKRRKM